MTKAQESPEKKITSKSDPLALGRCQSNGNRNHSATENSHELRL
jgi:hypothetical protein